MKNKKGFTLIELLVVVLIIGILAAIALPQYQKAVVKSRFAEALANLKTIASAHEVCYMEKGEACIMEEIAVSIGNGSHSRTNHFTYSVENPATLEMTSWAIAQYDQEDVCLCYLKTGEIVVNQNDGGCADKETSFDYAKLLKLREANYSTECGCC